MSERLPPRTVLAVTSVMLIAASAALGGAAAVSWARADFQVPLRGIVEIPLDGSTVLPALAPLAVLALAAVAAVLATSGRARWLLGALLLAAAVPPIVAVARVAGGGGLTGAMKSAGELPARSVPAGPVTVMFAGPMLAVAGAALLAAAGVALGVWGHRMPRLGRRYQAPTARSAGAQHGRPDRRLWERMDAGEDPTA